jgi:hypothetical protein
MRDLGRSFTADATITLTQVTPELIRNLTGWSRTAAAIRSRSSCCRACRCVARSC